MLGDVFFPQTQLGLSTSFMESITWLVRKETYQLLKMTTREFSSLWAKTFFKACSRLLLPSGCSFFTQSLSSWRLEGDTHSNLTTVMFRLTTWFSKWRTLAHLSLWLWQALSILKLAPRVRSLIWPLSPPELTSRNKNIEVQQSKAPFGSPN